MGLQILGLETINSGSSDHRDILTAFQANEGISVRCKADLPEFLGFKDLCERTNTREAGETDSLVFEMELEASDVLLTPIGPPKSGEVPTAFPPSIVADSGTFRQKIETVGVFLIHNDDLCMLIGPNMLQFNLNEKAKTENSQSEEWSEFCRDLMGRNERMGVPKIASGA